MSSRRITPAKRVVVACFTIFTLTACSSGTTPTGLSKSTVVTYEFQDSSVPPDYHRSIVLTVGVQEARIVVDSYGDVLADETTTTTASVWSQLMEGLETVAALTVDGPDEACVGGTSARIVVVDGAETIVDLVIGQCGGSARAATDAVDQWIEPARALFPATDVLAPEGE
jgi:hypothetical protein